MNTSRLWATWLTAIVLIAAVSTPGRAEEAILEGMSLEGLLNVPIIAASTIEERPSDSPATAYVVSAETIRDRGYTNLLDLLEDLPGFQVNHQVEAGHGNTVAIQGIHAMERYQVMYDGIRVTPLNGDLFAPGRQFSLRNARQVEIILGPISALYGPDVFCGVINIVTKSGDEMERDRLDLGAGAFGTSDLSLAAGRRLDRLPGKGGAFMEDGAMALTAHRLRSQGIDGPSVFPGEFSWYDQYRTGRMRTFPGSNVEVAVPFRPFHADEESDFLHGRFTLRNFELGFISMTEAHSSSVGVRPEYTLYTRDTVFETHCRTIYARHTSEGAGNRWKVMSQVSHQFYEVDPRTLFLNNFSNYQPAYKYARNKSTSFEERLTFNPREGRQFLLGLTYQAHSSLPRTEDLARPFDPEQSASSQGFIYPGSDLSTIEPQGIPIDFYQIDFENLGGYAQVQIRQNPRFSWIAGARYDKNSRYGSSFNPRLGIVLKPRDRLNLKLLYGMAFLAPSPSLAYSHFGSFVADPDKPGDIKSFYFHLPNPDLQPEKVKSTQAEATWRFSERLQGTLSLYDSWISDIQQTTSMGAGTFKGKPVSTLAHYVNLGTSRSYGGTLRLDTVRQFGRWRANAFAAFTYANGDIAGMPLPYVARQTLKAGLTLKKGRWTVSPRLIRQGGSFCQDKDAQGRLFESPGFTVTNLALQYRLTRNRSSTLSSFLNVANLTNTRYYNPGFASGGMGFAQVPQIPRSFSGGLTVEF